MFLFFVYYNRHNVYPPVHQERLQMMHSNEVVRRILGAVADSLPAVLNVRSLLHTSSRTQVLT